MLLHHGCKHTPIIFFKIFLNASASCGFSIESIKTQIRVSSSTSCHLEAVSIALFMCVFLRCMSVLSKWFHASSYCSTSNVPTLISFLDASTLCITTVNGFAACFISRILSFLSPVSGSKTLAFCMVYLVFIFKTQHEPRNESSNYACVCNLALGFNDSHTKLTARSKHMQAYVLQITCIIVLPPAMYVNRDKRHRMGHIDDCGTTCRPTLNCLAWRFAHLLCFVGDCALVSSWVVSAPTSCMRQRSACEARQRGHCDSLCIRVQFTYFPTHNLPPG